MSVPLLGHTCHLQGVVSQSLPTLDQDVTGCPNNVTSLSSVPFKTIVPLVNNVKSQANNLTAGLLSFGLVMQCYQILKLLFSQTIQVLGWEMLETSLIKITQ